MLTVDSSPRRMAGLNVTAQPHVRPVWRLRRTVTRTWSEIVRAHRITANRRSFARLAVDCCLYRVMRLVDPPGAGRRRRIDIEGAGTVTYRLNRGDIQSIREVWMEDGYRLPFEATVRVVVDLGANIGLTSMWLSRHHPVHTCVAVEPSAANAALVRENLAGTCTTVIEAAVGPRDGTVFFAESHESNLGRVAENGRPVPAVSMTSILDRLRPGTDIDVLKVDIEGAELELFSEHTEWLSSVKNIIIEIHPDRIDGLWVISRIVNAGFDYLPAGSVFPGSMDAFVRRT